MEEAAATQHPSGSAKINQTLVDRAVAAVASGSAEQRERGRKRKRWSHRSSNSNSESLRLLDRGGDNRIAFVAVTRVRPARTWRDSSLRPF
eukprot:5819134-Amphidinium_carterae.1